MNTYLTVNEIAEKLRVERHTVIRWITNGKLRAFKPGGGRLWRIRQTDLQRFVRGGK